MTAADYPPPSGKPRMELRSWKPVRKGSLVGFASDMQITLFAKGGGPLTKRIYLAPDGSLKSDGSACVMSRCPPIPVR
jgi:hypothetical protein